MRRFQPLWLIGGIALLTSPAFAGEVKSAVQVHLRARDVEGASPKGKLVVTPHEASVSAEIPLQGTDVSLLGAPGTRQTIRLVASGWWANDVEVTFPASSEVTYIIDVWRTATVAGRIVVGKDSIETPAEVTLMVESPPLRPGAQADIPRGTKFTCPVLLDGGWSCSVPATLLDLTLRAPNATPSYRWDVKPVIGRKTDLGAFALRRGASLVAWLDRGMASSLKHPAIARLLRPVADMGSPAGLRLTAPIAEATFTTRGWVQLAPVPAGSYVLEVSSSGFAPAKIGPIEIYDGKETSIRRVIQLALPLEVEVAIDPASDSGVPWEVEWNREPDFVTSAAALAPVTRRTDANGRAVIQDQSPGTFQIEVRDAQRNRLSSQSVRISDALDAHVAIKFQLHAVSGKVFLGNEPIAATLWFGGQDGAVRSRLQSDSSGEFHGRLPRPGNWSVQVDNQTLGVRTLVNVDVPDSEEPLDIRLPDTGVSGRVVGIDDRPAKRASVLVVADGRAFSTIASEDGTFSLRGLPAALVTIGARELTSGDSSPSVELRLQEGQTLRDVELKIDSSRDVAGTVTSAGVPVVGARVSGYPLDGQGMQSVRTGATDGEGAFKLAIPIASRRALITVAAPNRTLQSFDVVLDDGPVMLDVAPIGGTVIIQSEMPFTLLRNGVRLPLDQVVQWLLAHGDPLTDAKRLVVPDLAPGQYRACLTGSVSNRKCVDGALAPNGSIELRLSP